MPDARDDRDRVHNKNRKTDNATFAPIEDIGEMHFSAENHSTAIEYFQKALKNREISDYPDRYRIALRIAESHEQKGELDEAQEALAAARAYLGSTPDDGALAKIEQQEAAVLHWRGNYTEARAQAYQAFKRLRHSSEHRIVGDIQRILANCYYRLGQSTEAEDFYMDALSSYRRVDYKPGIAIVYNNLGLLHKNACRWTRALASLSKSLEMSESLGMAQHQIRAELNLGIVYSKTRRYTEALSACTRAASMAERLGDHYRLTKALLAKGRTYVHMGDASKFGKAEQYFLRAQTMAEEHGYKRDSALTDEYLGELMMARRQPREAMANLKKGLREARMVAPESDVVAEILRRMADACYVLNDVDKASGFADEALEAAEISEVFEVGFCYRVRGLCRLRRGDLPAAIKDLEASRKAFDQYENPYEACRSQQILARLLMRGQTNESLLKAKHVLSESVVGFGNLEESRDQMLSQLMLAVVEERLHHLDGALLAVYEADRLADDERDLRFKKLLLTIRNRIENKMENKATKTIEQLPTFGADRGSLRSREKMVEGLDATLNLITEQTGMHQGFIAIPGRNGKGLEVGSRLGLKVGTAKRILSWYRAEMKATDTEHKVMIRDADQAEGLDDLSLSLGTMVFQRLGSAKEPLGVVFVNRERSDSPVPIAQEALHFIGASSRLISLSVRELARNERRREAKPKSAVSGFESVVTENNDMIELLNLAERVAHSNATVLLQGETGTGKGLIAYAIHLLSGRRDKQFVHINCAAMPETLLESELFGHAKGSFTGAIHDKEGLLREADGGTIFLDEIGKTTLSMQGKLLQFLDAGKVRKVGSNDLVPVDVRVVCASKGDLLAMCEDGRFLEDFFYRINDFPLTIPPLRKRREDVELLFFHYLKKFSGEMGKDVSGISNEAMELLRNYRWAGNVRELEKVVKRAVILANDGDTLSAVHLPSEVSAPTVHAPSENGNGRPRSLRAQIERLERDEIQSSLQRNNWNKSQTALELGISYPSLLSKIKRYNLRVY